MKEHKRTIFITALEPSGDELGADLMRELHRASKKQIRFVGCGGSEMEKEGLESLFPVTEFSVIGITAAVKLIFRAYRAVRKLLQAAHHYEVCAVIMIDSWGFSRLLATKMRRYFSEMVFIKYVAPQVWASRPGRAKILKELFDLILVLMPFEVDFLKKKGVLAKCVGHHTIYRLFPVKKKPSKEFCAQYGVSSSETNMPVLLICLGSRKQEVVNLSPIFQKVVAWLTEENGNMRFFILVAPAVASIIRAQEPCWPKGTEFLYDSWAKKEACSLDAVSLVASGTVSVELGVYGIPMVVCYRLDPLTAFIAKRIVTTKYISLLNVAANKEVIPELIQEKCTETTIMPIIRDLLINKDARQQQVNQFPELLKKLGIDAKEPSPASQASQLILDYIGNKEQV